MTTPVDSAAAGNRVAIAANVLTAMRRAPVAYANVLAVVTAMRKPVNEPGPLVSATSSTSDGDQPASRSASRIAGAND